jgi:hypothetical protein
MIKQITNGAGSEWIRKTFKIEISDLGAAVADLLDYAWSGIYHLDEQKLKKADWTDQYIIQVEFRGSLQTFDFDFLSRLVLLSHDLMIRIDIAAANINLIRMTFHQRTSRDGSINDRMPTMEQHILDLRGYFNFIQPKKTRGSRSSKPLSLEKAVRILNLGGFRTKETKIDASITWKIQSEDQVAAFRDDWSDTPMDFIRRRTAIHRARQIIRRAPPISDFAQNLKLILDEQPEEQTHS